MSSVRVILPLCAAVFSRVIAGFAACAQRAGRLGTMAAVDPTSRACSPSRVMNPCRRLVKAAILRAVCASLSLSGLACEGTDERASAVPSATPPDSAAAARAALDTLRRLGVTDYVVDSLVRRGDTATVWAGPRIWMATDRPTTAVSLVAPARVVGVREVLGG
jgi:hypothetical protein